MKDLIDYDYDVIGRFCHTVEVRLVTLWRWSD